MHAHLNASGMQVARPLNVVDTQNKTGVQFIIDSLEKQVCYYITTQAESGDNINLKFIRELFSQAIKTAKG